MKTVFSNYIDQLQKKITSDIEKLDQNVKFKKILGKGNSGVEV